MQKRGQISMEYLLLVGLLLLVLIPLIYFSTREANLAATQSSAEDVVKTLAAAADEVYALGPGSRKTVEVNMPKGVVSISIGCIGGGCIDPEKKEINLLMNIYGGTADIFAATKGEVQGGIAITAGQKRIEVVALEDFILIGGDTFPPVIIFTSPSGTINYVNPTLVAITDEAATCKFASDDVDFDYDSTDPSVQLMIGDGTSHTVDLTLGEGVYTYSIKCRDFAEPPNTMDVRELVQFTIDLESDDTDPPDIILLSPVHLYEETETSLIRFKYQACDPSFALCDDDFDIESCTLRIVQTVGGQVITVKDTEVTEGATQSFTVSLGDGEYFWKVLCRDDPSLNEGESEQRKVIVNVAAGGGNIIGALEDLGIDYGFYYKTNGAGLSTIDAEMAATNEITLDLLDDDKNTPPATSVLRYRSGEKYEGFWVGVDDENSANSDKIVLYGRVSVIDLDPFNLTVHGYLIDKTTPNLATVLTFNIPDITGNPVKWIELDITDVARLEDGFGWMKFRVTATNKSTQASKRFQFSELHIKVGNYA